DTVARIGGDEFVVLLSGATHKSEVSEAIDRLVKAVAQPCQIDQIQISLTMSIGVTFFPHDAEMDPDALIRHADHAMYEAKHSGKNCICWFDPEVDRKILERRSHYERLVQAFEYNEFVMHYQPKVELPSGKVVGVEALIRWQHPQEGLLPPSRFLPTIEDTELTLPLGEWIMREALRQTREWQKLGINLPVWVNLFPHHLQQSNFAERLAKILQKFPDVAPENLNFEVLETTLLEDLSEVSKRIKACTDQGVSFALDDFGIGYSSLSYFSRLPVKVVKIDQSFIRGILSSPDDLALVQSTVSMAHSIGRKVVAEGVETLEHALPLIACGCDYAQGFGIARPMPAADMAAWIRGWRKPAGWKPIGWKKRLARR
ncbi:bifunctional diguanylate cyclase/phosphodiesterase, partial [Rhizobium sp.]|uniref:putative bifunctional diguanylate cyclase/phosphodiesterase n=1 Tax=Rhizobium sp. TaxID=391 RepID=UPI000E8D2D26|nr:hypothetical protein [Rhizobium sp.]